MALSSEVDGISSAGWLTIATHWGCHGEVATHEHVEVDGHLAMQTHYCSGAAHKGTANDGAVLEPEITSVS